MVGYYFDKKRALATGVSVCGAGIGAFIFGPVGSFLVENYAWKGANIIIGGVILNGIVFGLTYRPLKVRYLLHSCKRVKLTTKCGGRCTKGVWRQEGGKWGGARRVSPLPPTRVSGVSYDANEFWCILSLK